MNKLSQVRRLGFNAGLRKYAGLGGAIGQALGYAGGSSLFSQNNAKSWSDSLTKYISNAKSSGDIPSAKQLATNIFDGNPAWGGENKKSFFNTGGIKGQISQLGNEAKPYYYGTMFAKPMISNILNTFGSGNDSGNSSSNSYRRY